MIPAALPPGTPQRGVPAKQGQCHAPHATVPATEDGGDGVGTISEFGKAALAGLVRFMAGDETILIVS